MVYGKLFHATWVVLLASIAAFVSADARGGERLTVVELFTSQGCSSCPPADEYLGALSEREDVLPLSLHVDYWDYIGWKDPFADAAYTERQRQYQKHFNARYVYTPQMVIHGAYQAVGSKRGEVEERIKSARALPGLDVGLAREAGGLAIRVGAAGGSGVAAESASVWLVAFDERHQTEVARGENKGRTIVNRNVVRRFDLVGTWNGGAVVLRAPDPAAGSSGGQGVAVLVQSQSDGKILGAARLAAGR